MLDPPHLESLEGIHLDPKGPEKDPAIVSPTLVNPNCFGTLCHTFAICSLSGFSTAKLRPISSLQNSSSLGRVHLDLHSFNFWGVAFLSFRSHRACHIQAKLLTKCGTKNGPATQPHLWNLWGPFLWPF